MAGTDTVTPQLLPPRGVSLRHRIWVLLAEQNDEWAEGRRYLTIPNAVGNEALPTPNMLDAAA